MLTGKPNSTKSMRVKLQRGLILVKRGEIWYAETCRNGKQRRRSLETSDLPEAKRRAAENQEPPPQFPKEKSTAVLSMGKAFEDYEKWYERKNRSGRRSLPLVQWFVESVGEDVDTRQLTREHIQRFIDIRADGRAAITVRNDYARIRAFVKWIADRNHGAVLGNPCRAIERPKDDETTKEAPTVEKVRTVLRKLRGHAWLGDYATILVETGMRPAELLGLRGSDVKGSLVSIVPWAGRQLKSKWSKRTLQVNKAVAEILKARVGQMFDKGLAIFATEDGTVYKEQSAYHMFLRALEEEKQNGSHAVPSALRMTLYDFRHFFCSEHAAPGPQHMEIESLAAYIGHSPASTQTLLRWYADQRALRRGAPVSVLEQPKDGRVLAHR